MDNNNVNINVRLVEDNRVNISSFGSLYGKRIFKAVKLSCDLDFQKRLRDANENNGLVTNRAPLRYKIVPIDIVGLDLDKDVDGTNVIVINKGRKDEAGESIEVRCPIDNEKFTKDVTTETVTDALNKKDFITTYFANAKKLAEALNPANATEMNRIDALIRDLEKQRKMIQDTFDKNISGVNDYYRQLDQKKSEVHVNVTVD
jgi:hypothetical protein